MILNNWIVAEKFIKNNKNINHLDFPGSPIVIKSFDGFSDVSSKTLDMINQTTLGNREVIEKEKTNITKSDFHLSSEPKREWLTNIEELLMSNIMDMCMSIGYMGFIMNNVWFQQYDRSSSHQWHLHQFSNYSGVFYLEFPKDGPRTEFYNFSKKESHFLDMSEGDIAIFPAHLPHRSPINNSEKRKTIVSFNISFSFPLENQNYINSSLDKRYA